LQYRYVLLAYAGSPDAEPSFPIAVVCVHPDIARGDSALFVKDNWEQKVKDSHRGYIEECFHDWLGLMEGDPGVLLPQILELSVGPFRTVGDGECDEQELTTRLEAFLVGSYRRLT
jgi:hypothetical protein